MAAKTLISIKSWKKIINSLSIINTLGICKNSILSSTGPLL